MPHEIHIGARRFPSDLRSIAASAQPHHAAAGESEDRCRMMTSLLGSVSAVEAPSREGLVFSPTFEEKRGCVWRRCAEGMSKIAGNGQILSAVEAPPSVLVRSEQMCLSFRGGDAKSSFVFVIVKNIVATRGKISLFHCNL